MALQARGLDQGHLKGCHAHNKTLHITRHQLLCARTVQAAAATRPMQATEDAYDKLKGRKVFRSSDFAELDIPSLWGPDEKALVAFTRSMG